MRRITTKEFIERAKAVHGDRFDYSLVHYKTSKVKVKIICPDHGEFEQAPTNHLSGSGCMECRLKNWSKNGISRSVMDKRGALFFEKCRAVHNGRYDYSMSEYKGSRKKILIGCPIHGEIWVVASGHLKNGFGCNRCYFDRISKKHTKIFIEESKKVHADAGYDYSLVEYNGSGKKVKIICLLHGVFETTPYRHMNGVGCHECNGPNYRGFFEQHKKMKLNKKMFVERSMESHGDKYDYSKSVYVNNRTKTEIICKKHKRSFFQTPDNHMKGVGCPYCKFEKTNKLLAISKKEINRQKRKTFVDDMKKIHGNKYDYSLTVYEKWDGKIKIICPTHGVFTQGANNHSQGAGCPQCAPSGFNNKIPAILYYLEITTDENKKVYKIGITNRTVFERYFLESDRAKMKIIKTWGYSLGIEARKMEKKILRLHKEHLYHGEPPLLGVGVNEIFDKDVLCLVGAGV